MSNANNRLAMLREIIGEVSASEAFSQQKKGAVILDIRSGEEIVDGSPSDAIAIERDFLEFEVENSLPDTTITILTLCASGGRSLFTAETLKSLGYKNVKSIKGGYKAWVDNNLPIEAPRKLNKRDKDRYSRHLKIPEIGESGQLTLLDSKVLLIGAGGLGSPVALYLAAAGVGKIGLVDFDVVERSNLQRQILHTDERKGKAKVDSAEQTLKALNPDVDIVKYPVHLTHDNIEEIIKDYEVIVDGTDNFPTRYLVNDACVKLNLPNVYGSILRFAGQVSVFWPTYKAYKGPCYRCLYPEPPPPKMSPSCAEAGVLGVLPGVIGLLQAVEVIKILLNIGEPLIGRLVCYDALQAKFSEYALKPNPNCNYCGHLQLDS